MLKPGMKAESPAVTQVPAVNSHGAAVVQRMLTSIDVGAAERDGVGALVDALPVTDAGGGPTVAATVDAVGSWVDTSGLSPFDPQAHTTTMTNSRVADRLFKVSTSLSDPSKLARLPTFEPGNGADTRTWTEDLLFTKQLLYR